MCNLPCGSRGVANHPLEGATMHRHTPFALTALLAVTTLACDGGSSEDYFTTDILITGPAAAQAVDRNFPAPLKGREEVPPVETHATGLAKFQLSKDGTALDFKLIVANIDDVTQAHIHLAPVGTNGPIVVFLFGFDPVGVTTNGILSQGTISADDLIGLLLASP